MNGTELTARLLAPIWQGFFISELVNRELQKELEDTAKNPAGMREYAALLEASDYLKRRSLEFDSIGLMTVIQSIGGKAFIWPWDGDLSEAFMQVNREMFTRNPKLLERANAVGLGLLTIEKQNRDIQHHNEKVKRLQSSQPAQASA